MTRLACLGVTIVALIAPIQVEAQQCVTFPRPPNPEAEIRYLRSHPNTIVCPSETPNYQGQVRILYEISRNRVINTESQIRAWSGP